MQELAEFPWHDATLESIEYTGGAISLKVKFHTGEQIFKFGSPKKVVIDQEEIWGPSNSINSFEYLNQNIRIEMQSGTIISIENALLQN